MRRKRSTAAQRLSSYLGGYRIIPSALMRRTDVSPAAKLVMVRLVYYWNEDKQKAWPSFDTLAEEVGLEHKSQAFRAVEELVKMGWVEKIHVAERSKPSCEYKIRWRRFDEAMGNNRARQIINALKRARCRFDRRIMPDGQTRIVIVDDKNMQAEIKENLADIAAEMGWTVAKEAVPPGDDSVPASSPGEPNRSPG